MISDVDIMNTEEVVLKCVEGSTTEAIGALQDRFVYLAAYPARAMEEDKYLLALTAILLKNCKRSRICSSAQVAHICECAEHFSVVFDNTIGRNDYRFFSIISEPWKAEEEFTTNHNITSELIVTLIQNWDRVKHDTYVYRLLNDLLTTIPK